MNREPFYRQQRIASLVVAIGIIVIVSMAFPAVRHGASALAASPERPRPPYPAPTATVPLADPTVVPMGSGEIVTVNWSIQEKKYEKTGGCCGSSSEELRASNLGELTYWSPADPAQPTEANPFQMVVSFDREEHQDDGCMTHLRTTRILDGDRYSSPHGTVSTGRAMSGLFTRYGSGNNWYIRNPISALMAERTFTYEYAWHQKTGDPCQPYETGEQKQFIAGSPTHDSEIVEHDPWIYGDGTSFWASKAWKRSDGVIITDNITVTFGRASGSIEDPMGISNPDCGPF